MKIRVTFQPDETMVRDAIALLYAQGKTPSVTGVREVLRKWYETSGLVGEAETLEDRVFPDNIEITDTHYMKAELATLLTHKVLND